MEFSELNDEIGADDWLIASEEITRRRLVKRTPRYNIYKADWFGDVLIYEPIKSTTTTLTAKADVLPEKSSWRAQVCLDELSTRLSELSCYSPTATTPVDMSLESEPQTDSAYSSISSTPQYHTKSISQNEFEFPEARHTTIPAKQREPDSLAAAAAAAKKPAVILNKDSFVPHHQKGIIGKDQMTTTSVGQDQSSWFELNELRLVAHESFMLFMGACPPQPDSDEQANSLVMQMSHPKAISLHNLLHGQKLINTSPIDRFFASKRQQLGRGAKLNICQQVTNAMTYLHDKNIVHAKLTSVNIYLELNQRVKISLIDHDEQPLAATTTTGGQSAQFNLRALAHLSPELVRTIAIATNCDNDQKSSSSSTSTTPHVQFDPSQLTKMADIFSFGTLLFELFEEQFPFTQEVAFDTSIFLSHFDSPKLFTASGLSNGNSPLASSPAEHINWNGNITASAQEMIFQIGSGLIGEKNLHKLATGNRCPALVQDIISRCWSTDPSSRPNFKQLSTLF